METIYPTKSKYIYLEISFVLLCIRISFKCAVKPSAPNKRDAEHVILSLSAFPLLQSQGFLHLALCERHLPDYSLNTRPSKQPHKSRTELIADKRK